MGKPTAESVDLALSRTVGTIAAASQRAPDSWTPPLKSFPCAFNLWLSGAWTGNVGVTMSRDGGTTWVPVTFSGTATPMLFSAPVVCAMTECEAGVLYAAYTDASFSGSVNYTFSTGWNGVRP